MAVMIRRARKGDEPALWRILRPVIRRADTYALPSDMSRAAALAYWTARAHEVFVAEQDGTVVGTYYLRANQQGGGAHVANCGYATLEAARGQGVGRAMCLHSLAHARECGFRAMQFNFVVASNEGALRLWESLGFAAVGRLPRAFLHPQRGYVDALVMYRELVED
jgi:L-amino acid N-acyltransferase YncA